jgi:hypothetical protein
VFGTELMEVVDAGSGLVVGTVGPGGEPRATRAWALTVTDAATRRIRLVMSADDRASVDNLATGRVTVTGADVSTLRAVQLKGRVEAVRPAEPDDVDVMIQHSSTFFRAVHDVDGNPMALLERMLPTEIVVVDVVVDEVFDQTPGPTAGSPVPGTTSS